MQCWPTGHLQISTLPPAPPRAETVHLPAALDSGSAYALFAEASAAGGGLLQPAPARLHWQAARRACPSSAWTILFFTPLQSGQLYVRVNSM